MDIESCRRFVKMNFEKRILCGQAKTGMDLLS